MAAGNLRIFWHDGIGPTLEVMTEVAVTRATAVMEESAGLVEDYAKANAPWTDRTGDARNSLTAEADEDFEGISIILSHGVDYGYWLELIQNGNFAIIMPTLEALGPEILEAAGAAVLTVTPVE